jgi:inorganic pyrophosphatase
MIKLFKIIIIIFFSKISFAESIKETDKYSIKFKKNLIHDIDNSIKEQTINIVVEISKNTSSKWQISKIDGSLEHEFFMGEPRIVNYSPYPVNYGIIPRTVIPINKGGDGDPLDVIVIGKEIEMGKVMKVKVIGVLKMKDFGEQDDKIIAVQLNDEFSKYNEINELKKSNNNILDEVILWFQNYKGENITKVFGYETSKEALNLIMMGSRYYKKYGIKKR